MKTSLLLFICAILILPLNAQWNSDTNINTPICTAFYKQKEQRLESDGKGGAFIVWKDWRFDGFLPDIYVQRVDSNGYPLWTVDGAVACDEPSDQSTPAITTDEKDGVIIAWSDERSGGKRDVFAQRIDANGNKMWAVDGVPVATKVEREHSEKIVSDDHGGVFVVWEQERLDFSWDIWAQRIDSSGNAVWVSGGIPVCNVTANRINHKIQRDGEGGLFVTWQDERSGNFDIYVQRIDANGNLLWNTSGVSVCAAPGVQSNPKIDPEKQLDGVYIAWVDKRNGTDYDVYCNRVDSNGNVLWGAMGKPVAVGSGNQSAIDILSNNKTEGLIVTWKDNRSPNYDIYIQKINLSGEPVWALNGIVVCDAPEDQLNPNIISDKAGGAIIAWQDFRYGDWDVFSQRVSANGIPQWTVNGEAVSTAVGEQESPKNIPDNKGGSIYAWEDKRGGVSKDIYIHHLLLEDTTRVGIRNQYGLTNIQVYPNPFQANIHIDLALSSNSKISFRLYNQLGVEVYSNDQFIDANSGHFEIKLEAFNLNSGLYYLAVSTADGFQNFAVLKQ
jgi:hypothetical protein